MIQEEAIVFGKKNNLLGIVTKASDRRYPVAAIFLNAGLIHHVGPQRIYVNLARELAGMGMHAFRFDFSGIGDSIPADEALSFEDTSVHEVTMAMEYLKQAMHIDKFLLIGICSGAEIAFKTALEKDGVTGCVLINGIYLEGNEYKKIIDLAFEKNRLRYYLKNIFKLDKWIRFLKGKSMVSVRSMLQKKRNPSLEKKEGGGTLVNNDAIRARHKTVFEKKVHVLYLFSEGSVAQDIFNLQLKNILKQNPAWKNYDVLSMEKTDHTFTSVRSQHELQQHLVNYIKDKRF
jgi:alpha-beta hydrolase superfamily lysophospholipase